MMTCVELERQLSVKCLENKKLREAIDDYQKQLSESTKEVEILQKSLNDEVESSQDLQNSSQNLQRSVSTLEEKLKSNAEKIRKLQENNHRLMEELLDAKKTHYRIEKESVTISEENCKLIFDLSILQQQNRQLESDFQEIILDTFNKEQNLTENEREYKVIKDKNAKLKEEMLEFKGRLDNARSELSQKNMLAAKLTLQVADLQAKFRAEIKLKKEVEKLRGENERMSHEIKTNEENANLVAELLLKNKTLLNENKQLKIDNHKISEYLESLKTILENSETEIVKLKKEKEKVIITHEETMQFLKDAELHQFSNIQTEKELLKSQAEIDKDEIQSLKRFLTKLLQEIYELKTNSKCSKSSGTEVTDAMKEKEHTSTSN